MQTIETNHLRFLSNKKYANKRFYTFICPLHTLLQSYIDMSTRKNTLLESSLTTTLYQH